MELVYALSPITEMRKQYFVGLLSLLLIIDVYMWACKLVVRGNEVLESNGGYIDEKIFLSATLSSFVINTIKSVRNFILTIRRIRKQMYTPYAN